MPISWPSAPFPQFAMIDGYSETMADAKLRTEMDAGPAKVRRRFTSVPRRQTCKLRMTNAQLTAAGGFDVFYVTDTSHGSAEFTWANPRTPGTPVTTMRFVGTPSYTALAQDIWEVTFDVEILP